MGLAHEIESRPWLLLIMVMSVTIPISCGRKCLKGIRYWCEGGNRSISHRSPDLRIYDRNTTNLFLNHCSKDIRNIITYPFRCVKSTRKSTHSHPFQITLPNPLTLSLKSPPTPSTCNQWNVLTSSVCYDESYNLSRFDLISLSP